MLIYLRLKRQDNINDLILSNFLLMSDGCLLLVVAYSGIRWTSTVSGGSGIRWMSTVSGGSGIRWMSTVSGVNLQKQK